MKKMAWASLLFMLPRILKGLQAHPMEQMELTRLKISLMYLRSIKTFRLLFMSLLSIGICLIFFFTGLVLLHLSVFLYAPWEPGIKMVVGLLCSLVYLLAAVFIFYQVFSSDKWVKIFHADALMDKLKNHDQSDRSLSQTT